MLATYLDNDIKDPVPSAPLREWRWRQSSANLSLFRISLLCGKIQGNFDARGRLWAKLPSH